MNNDEYLRSMKQAIDESIKEDEKIQQFLVWLHEKTASLGSPYQESALRAFYCDVVEGTQSVNRQISRMLDSNLDKDIDEIRGIADQLTELWDNDKPVQRLVYEIESREPAYSNFPQINFKRLVHQVDTSPAVDIVVDRNLALACKSEAGQKYTRQAAALLIRESDEDFQKKILNHIYIYPRKKESLVDYLYADYIYNKRLEQWRQSLSLCLYQYLNLKLDWQFSIDQQRLLNNYYAANKLLVDCLQESHASPEVRQEIEETLLLPIIEIYKRKNIKISFIKMLFLLIKALLGVGLLLIIFGYIVFALFIIFVPAFRHYIWTL